MGYVSITNALVTILQTVTELQIVYGYEPKLLNKFPSATVTALTHKNVFEDLAANKRTYQHKITLYYRTDVAQDAESVLQKTADSVITAIEADVTLGGVVDYSEPSDGKWMYQQREVPVRLVEITVSSIQRVNR